MNKFIRNGVQRSYHWDGYVRAKTKIEAFCFFFDVDDEVSIDEEMLGGKVYLLFSKKDGYAAVVEELYYSWELESNIYEVRPVFGNYNNE